MAPRRWWLFLGAVFVIGVLFKVYPLAVFTLMLALVSALALAWRNHALVNVAYLRRFAYRCGFPGERVDFHIEVENRKFLPLSWLRTHDAVHVNLAPQDESLLSPTHNPEVKTLSHLFSLRWFERDRRAHTLLLRQRGIYPIGPVTLESGDFLGLFDHSQERDNVDYLTVFPEPLPFEALHLPTDDPFGDRKARRRLYEDPNLPMGVRDYHPEDDFRRIHWGVTAHTGQLQVRVFQPISAKVLVLCLNISTFPHYWEGTFPDLLEHLVRVSAAIVQRGIQEGYRVGLLSNGSLAHSDQPFRVPPGRSPEQFNRLFSVLAAVTPFQTGSFDRLLMAEAPRIPYGATLVIVTGIVTPQIVEAIARLKGRGRQMTVLNFSRQPFPHLPGVVAIHQPFMR